MDTSTNQIFYYKPSISTIIGRLTIIESYGPPNYGETPKEDMKLKNLVLLLKFPINVFSQKTIIEEGDFDTTHMGIDCIQLLVENYADIEDQYLNKEVMIKGRFFGSHTGYHITPVLMEVETVSLFSKNE